VAWTGRVTLTLVTIHNEVRSLRPKATMNSSMGPDVVRRGGGGSRRQRAVEKERVWSGSPVTEGCHP